MQWLSADFAQERRWKRGVARKVYPQLGLPSISGLLFLNRWVGWKGIKHNSGRVLINAHNVEASADFPDFLALIILFAFDFGRGQESGLGVFSRWSLVPTGGAHGDRSKYHVFSLFCTWKILEGKRYILSFDIFQFIITIYLILIQQMSSFTSSLHIVFFFPFSFLFYMDLQILMYPLCRYFYELPLS